MTLFKNFDVYYFYQLDNLKQYKLSLSSTYATSTICATHGFCFSPLWPAGVHQKAIDVLELVFTMIGVLFCCHCLFSCHISPCWCNLI